MNRFHKANEIAIEKAARAAVLDCLTKGFKAAKGTIEPEARNLVIDGLRNEPAYNSILRGKLKSDFGLTDDIATGFLANLEELLKSKIKAYFEPVNSKTTIATIYLQILKIDLEEIFAIPQASYISESKRGAFEIEWLRWLLTEGSRVVVSGFQTSKEGTSVVSRSGRGVIMLPSKDGAFRVHPSFAGSEQSNLITRSVLSNIDKIEQMFVEQILKIFK